MAHRLGLCDREITVHMPGGELEITVGDGFSIDMTGPVTRVGEGDRSTPRRFADAPKGI